MHMFLLAAYTGLIPERGLPHLSLPLLTADNKQSGSCSLLGHDAYYVPNSVREVTLRKLSVVDRRHGCGPVGAVRLHVCISISIA